MQSPPLLPEETLARVLRISGLESKLLLVLAAGFAFAAALMGDRVGVAIGLLAAGAGAVELHGVALLRNGAARGMRWLVASQFFLLTVVLLYVAVRLSSFDPALIRPFITAEMRQAITQAGLTEPAFIGMVRKVYLITYGAVGVISVFYQGGMALYYHRRQAAVDAALAAE